MFSMQILTGVQDVSRYCTCDAAAEQSSSIHNLEIYVAIPSSTSVLQSAADRHVVCWLTALFCDVTPCSLVTVVQAADRICGTTRVHSSAVADQSNCGPGHDAMSGW